MNSLNEKAFTQVDMYTCEMFSECYHSVSLTATTTATTTKTTTIFYSHNNLEYDHK